MAIGSRQARIRARTGLGGGTVSWACYPLTASTVPPSSSRRTLASRRNNARFTKHVRNPGFLGRIRVTGSGFSHFGRLSMYDVGK